MMEDGSQNDKKKDGFDRKEIFNMALLFSLSLEIGFLILIPLIFFVLLSRYLDVKLGTFPLFLIIGIVLALITSSLAIYRKIKQQKF